MPKPPQDKEEQTLIDAIFSMWVKPFGNMQELYFDGEGGFTVWGKCIPASQSLAHGALPLGLAHGCRMRTPVKKGATLRWSDVDFEGTGLEESLALRREMESMCSTSEEAHARERCGFDVCSRSAFQTYLCYYGAV